MSIRVSRVSKGVYLVNEKKVVADGDVLRVSEKLSPAETESINDFIESENKQRETIIGPVKVQSTIK